MWGRGFMTLLRRNQAAPVSGIGTACQVFIGKVAPTCKEPIMVTHE